MSWLPFSKTCSIVRERSTASGLSKTDSITANIKNVRVQGRGKKEEVQVYRTGFLSKIDKVTETNSPHFSGVDLDPPGSEYAGFASLGFVSLGFVCPEYVHGCLSFLV